MTNFNYKKWITENKYGKNLYEQNAEPGDKNTISKKAPLSIPPPPSPGNPGGSTGWYCVGTGTVGPSCINASLPPAGTTGGPYPNQTFCQSVCAPTGSGTSSQAPICHHCDTGSATPFINSSYTAFDGNVYNYGYNGGYFFNAQGDCYTNGPMLFGNLNLSTIQATCTTQPTGSGCDNSPNSQCAQTYFGPNASNFTNYMSNQSCTTYQSTKASNQAGAVQLAQNSPNGNANWTYNPTNYPNYNQIVQIANQLFGTGGAGQPQKGQFKRKAAKVGWAQCLQNTGCCATNESFVSNSSSNFREDEELYFELEEEMVCEMCGEMHEGSCGMGEASRLQRPDWFEPIRDPRMPTMENKKSGCGCKK